MQTKKHSIIEAICNVASGMLIAFLVTQTIGIHLLGIKITYSSNLILTVILTVVSVLRGYVWRRFFNHKTIKLRKENCE